MRRQLFPVFAAAAALGASAAVVTDASAAEIFTATLTNAAEPVPVGSPPVTPTLQNGLPRPASFGEATLTLNDAETALTYSITVFNIDFTGSQTADPNDNLLAAHIHASPTVTSTTTAGVVFGFIGTPFNENEPNDVVVTPFTTGVGGTVTGKWDQPEGNPEPTQTLTAQLSNLRTQHAYLNFHTTQFGSGEVRGTIILVPEPAAAGLAALAGFGALARRRRVAR